MAMTDQTFQYFSGSCAPTVPQELMDSPQWVLWRYETKDGRKTKVPYSVSGKRASSTNSSTWASFVQVQLVYESNRDRYSGIGFVFTPHDPYTGVDVDDCLDADGKPKEWALPIIDVFTGTYMERSPSGRGVKIWCRATINNGKGKKMAIGDGAIEVYDRGRYFTVTSDVFQGAPLKIAAMQQAVDSLCALNPERLRSAPPAVLTTAKAETVATTSHFNEGSRHKALLSEAAKVAGQGMSRDQLVQHMLRYNQSACHPPKSEAEVIAIVDWVVEQENSMTATAQEIVGEVLKTGDISLLYLHIDAFAGLPVRALEPISAKLRQSLGRKFSVQAFNRAIKEERRRHSATPRSASDLPVVHIADRSLSAKSADAIAALQRANDPPVVYRRSGVLAQVIADEHGRLQIRDYDEPMMRGRLARVADFMVEGDRGLVHADPPRNVVLDVLVDYTAKFPPLVAISQSPMFRPDWSFSRVPGYDAVLRTYYSPEPGFILPPIPDAPSRDQLDSSVQRLQELIGQFAFETEADRANAFALIISPFVLLALDTMAPLALIDSPKAGSGKSLLASAVYAIATGQVPAVFGAVSSEEENRKRITAILERGQLLTIIDNVEQALRSPSLAAVLTTPRWEDRIMGVQKSAAYLNRMVWIATGNNIQTAGDVGRRCYWIRLDAKMASPETRSGFRYEDQELIKHILSNRATYVGAIYTLVMAWVAAGCPQVSVLPMGSFGAWARVVGSILAVAGIQGFLANREKRRSDSDLESGEWEDWLSAWAVTFGSRPVSVAEVAKELVGDTLLSRCMPSALVHYGHVAAASMNTRIGACLRGKRGAHFGPFDFRIDRVGTDSHSKGAMWQLSGDFEKFRAAECGNGDHCDVAPCDAEQKDTAASDAVQATLCF